MKISEILFAIYACLYLLAWEILLRHPVFIVLKPWAAVWIGSGIFCFIVAIYFSYLKYKKQFPFFSFFIGSVFGPLGILMVIFSDSDVRAFTESEKDQKFYEHIANDIFKLFDDIEKYNSIDQRNKGKQPVLNVLPGLVRANSFLGSIVFIIHGNQMWLSGQISTRLEYYANYFKIKLDFTEDGKGSQYTVSTGKLFNGLKKIATAYEEETKLRHDLHVEKLLENIKLNIEALSEKIYSKS